MPEPVKIRQADKPIIRMPIMKGLCHYGEDTLKRRFHLKEKDIRRFLNYEMSGDIKEDMSFIDEVARSIEDEFDADSFTSVLARNIIRSVYGFSIPSDNALNKILSFSNDIISIGSGAAYWESLLSKKGANVLCYDESPPMTKGNEFGLKMQWMNVEKGSIEKLEGIKDMALLLSWPNYNTNFGLNALNAFEGETVFYIGESKYGCCATDEFFEKLDLEFSLADAVCIPRWPHINDDLYVYTRRSFPLRG